MAKKPLDILAAKTDIEGAMASKEVRAYMAALARRKARRMTAEERRDLALKMNAARWGKRRKAR